MKERAELEVRNAEAHDGRLVQLLDGARQDWQLRRQVGEQLRLLAAPTSRRIARLLLPLLGVPAKYKTERSMRMVVISP